MVSYTQCLQHSDQGILAIPSDHRVTNTFWSLVGRIKLLHTSSWVPWKPRYHRMICNPSTWLLLSQRVG